MTNAPKNVLKLYGFTQRQWRAHKRAQLKAVVKAFKEYRLGCAYTPSYRSGDICTLENVLNRMTNMHSSKEWKGGSND